MVAVVAGLFALGAGGLGWLAKMYGDKATEEAGKTKIALEKAEKQTKRASAQERIAESRRLALLSDLARPKRLDQAMLLAAESAGEDTLEARGGLCRRSMTGPKSLASWMFPRAGSGAWPSARAAPSPRDTAAAWCSSTPGASGCGRRRWRSPRARSTAWPSVRAATFAAGYTRGVVLFDARGEQLRSTPLEVPEGQVSSLAFGPGGTLAAGYTAATSTTA